MLVNLSSGKFFAIAPDVSILEAAESQQLPLPYSCRTGRCSTCKSKVIKGESRALQEEKGLTAEEKADGYILSCVRAAVTDLMLEVDDFGGVTLPQSKIIPCKIKSIIFAATDVIVVTLRLPPASDFTYLAGQYINIIGPGGVRRSYSLANSDASDKQLELHIRAVEGGAMSKYWFEQAKVNDLLRLRGPLGTFFLRDLAELDLVFLATGTGIAPVKAMLETIVQFPAERQPRSTTVLWGGRITKDLYFDVKGISGDFQFLPVLSRADEQWSGARGYVQEVLLKIFPNLSNTVVYACGSDTMINAAKVTLENAGLRTNRFYSDAFVCSAFN